MLKCSIKFPVEKEHQLFCEHMGYSFIEEKEDKLVYLIPVNHLCRFLINFQEWTQGTFDKDIFIKQNEE